MTPEEIAGLERLIEAEEKLAAESRASNGNAAAAQAAMSAHYAAKERLFLHRYFLLRATKIAARCGNTCPACRYWPPGANCPDCDETYDGWEEME